MDRKLLFINLFWNGGGGAPKIHAFFVRKKPSFALSAVYKEEDIKDVKYKQDNKKYNMENI